MVMIPDGWPTDDSAGATTFEAPVFPLAGVFLFPGQILPLHIFEPRYRDMIEDCLDGPGRIVVAPVASSTDAGAEPLPDRAGLGEIARHEKLEDGRFLIWLGGIARVDIEEVPSERPYRRSRCTITSEILPTTERADRLREPLVDAISERVDDRLELDAELPIGLLTDLLSQCIQMPTDALRTLFGETDVAKRAELALDAHARYPTSPSE